MPTEPFTNVDPGPLNEDGTEPAVMSRRPATPRGKKFAPDTKALTTGVGKNFDEDDDAHGHEQPKSDPENVPQRRAVVPTNGQAAVVDTDADLRPIPIGPVMVDGGGPPSVEILVKAMRDQLRDGFVAGGRVGGHEHNYVLQTSKFGYVPMRSTDGSEPKRISGPFKEDEGALEACAKDFREMHIQALARPKPARMDHIAQNIKTGGKKTPRIDALEEVVCALRLQLLEAQELLAETVAELVLYRDKFVTYLLSEGDEACLLEKTLAAMDAAFTCIGHDMKAMPDHSGDIKNGKRRLTVIENKLGIGPSARKGKTRDTKGSDDDDGAEDDHAGEGTDDIEPEVGDDGREATRGGSQDGVGRERAKPVENPHESSDDPAGASSGE